MIVRMAAVMALVAFALCVVVGMVEADNPFGTTVQRALVAMAGTMVIGLGVGWCFRQMMKESLSQAEKKLKEPPASPAAGDR
jgi:ABC-type nickel/cobalt efflux system permease component RcnA